MSVHYLNLPRRKPTPDQLELPRVKIGGIVHDLNATLSNLQLRLITAGTADELAAAIVETHRTLAEASAGFAGLVEATRAWK
jgi:hypothetical protein